MQIVSLIGFNITHTNKELLYPGFICGSVCADTGGKSILCPYCWRNGDKKC